MVEKTNAKIANQTQIKNEIEKFTTNKEYLILVKYTINRLYLKFNIKADNDFSIRGIMIKDIIQNISLSFLSEGKRNWNKEKFPDFRDQFYSALDSEIANTVKSHLKKHNITYPINESDKILTTNPYEDQQYLEHINKALEKLDATDEEIILLEPILNKVKRDDISKEFGISPQEVTNIKKRLTRKLIKIINQLNPSSNYEPHAYTKPD